MENTKTIVNIYDSKALTSLVVNTIEEIKAWSNKLEYRLEFELDKNSLTEEISNASGKQKKRINAGARHFSQRPTLRSANRFLHTIFRKVLKAQPVKIQLSEKETKIQDARKAWKNAMLKAEELRLVYKAEKGNFYK